MKYLKVREVSTTNDVNKYSQCSMCGKKQPSFWVTVDKQLVCHECKGGDTEVEFVNRER